MTERLVVAGFDGSECSLHAARWAAAAADQRGTGLLLVCATDLPDQAEADRAAALLAAAEARVRQEHPSLRVTTQFARSPAASSLRECADRAQLIVVGSWGSGRMPGVPLGSVAFCVASTSPTPVAVVRPEHRRPVRRPVAVAVDARSIPHGALEFGFATADACNVRLLVLHVRHDVAIDGAFPYQVVRDRVGTATIPTVRTSAQSEEDRTAMAWQLIPWQRRYPRVNVTPVVLFGTPTATLLDFSHRTDLLVIGDARRGVNSGLFLGSTGQELLYRSACPVVVARSTDSKS